MYIYNAWFTKNENKNNILFDGFTFNLMSKLIEVIVVVSKYISLDIGIETANPSIWLSL